MFLGKVFERLAFTASQHAPALYFAAGAVGLVGTGIAIWNARPKCDAILEEYHDNCARIEAALAKVEQQKAEAEAAGVPFEGEDYTKKDALMDKIGFGMKAAVKFAKALYAPIAMFVGTAGFFTASYLTNANRIVKLGKAYAKERARNASLEVVAASVAGGGAMATLNKVGGGEPVTVVGDDGKAVKTKTVLIEPGSMTDFFGPGYSLLSNGDNEADRFMLRKLQDQLTDKLRSRMEKPSVLHPRGLPGWLTLQEVRDELQLIGKDGIRRPTEFGSGIGWTVYPLEEDNKRYGCAGEVNFGCFDIHNEGAWRWQRGAEETVQLIYNCDKFPLWGRGVFTKGDAA